MNTTKPAAAPAPARNALKVRTALKAGALCTNENLTDALRDLRPRPAGFLGGHVEGTGI